jgi:hypothetical protein
MPNKNPPSQVLAHWVTQELTREWTSLRTILATVANQQMTGRSHDAIADLVEENIQHVERHLRNEVNVHEQEGTVCQFEIDQERPPFVRIANAYDPDHLSRLKQLTTSSFEQLCSAILANLGGRSEVTGSPADGGVDFVAFNLKFLGEDLPIPTSTRMSVIGQAKHQKEPVVESEVRKFVGGATRRLHRYRVEGKVSGLSPVVLAFWTTSDFREEAAEYARAVGLWYLTGHSIAQYAASKGLLPPLETPVARQ